VISVKKFFLFVFIVIACVFAYFGYQKIEEKKYIEEVKKGWYVEVIHDDGINVRDLPSTDGEILGKAKKGDVYKVLDIKTDAKTYYWYKIEYKHDIAYIASGKKIHWVNDINNPNDIAVPIIKYYDNIYKVVSIDDINYKHLEVVEDTDIYTITHVVYHEVNPSENINQYWINYTITDGAGKSSSKLQKIEFEEKPDESKVKDFTEYLKNNK